MIRKWLTSLLAMLLALMLPFCAMADTQHTLTIIPGDILASDEAISDLFKALSFTLTTGDESGAVSIAIDGESVLHFAGKADTTGLYVHSNLLSDDVLYVTWEDGIAVLTQLMTAEMGEEEAKAFQQSMEQVQKSMTLEQNVAPTAPISKDDGMKLAREMYADDPGMVAWIENLYNKMTVEEGEFASPDRDTATQKWTIAMTSDDFIAMCDTNLMRSTMEEAIKAENPELKGEALTAAVDEALDETREIYRQMNINIAMMVYTVDDGLTTVGMEMDFPMTVQVSETEQETMHMTLVYNRKTDDNGVAHKADMTMLVNDASMMDIVFDLYKGADGVSKGMAAMLVEGEEITVLYNAFNQGDTRTRRADLYLRSGASAIIEPAASDRPLIGFQVVSKAADPAVLEPVEKANSSSAVNVMKMSEEDLNDLMTDIEARAMQILFSAMSKLPASVMMLITEGME